VLIYSQKSDGTRLTSAPVSIIIRIAGHIKSS